MVVKLPVYWKEWGTPWEAFYRTETWEEVVWWGGGGGGWRYNYGSLFLSDKWSITQSSLDYHLNGWDWDRVYKWVQNWEYNLSLIDIVEYDENTQVELVRHEWVPIVNESNIYTYMQANCPNNWTSYDNVIRWYVYDVIDSTIPWIEKASWMNAFYASLMWGGNYKRSNNPSLMEGESKLWIFADIVQDMIRTMTPNTSYPYHSWDEPRRVIRTPRNHRTLYWLINWDWVIYNSNGWRYSIDSSNNFVHQTWEYNINHDESWYYILNLNTLNFDKKRKHELKEVMQYINNPNFSVILAYQVQLNDNYSVFIKPVWVDSVYVDYFDANLYELYWVHHARNQRISLQKITVHSFDSKSNSSWILKPDWMYKQHSGKSKWGYREQPYTQFILRNKTTNKVSSLSNARIQWRWWKDRPIYATVNY